MAFDEEDRIEWDDLLVHSAFKDKIHTISSTESEETEDKDELITSIDENKIIVANN